MLLFISVLTRNRLEAVKTNINETMRVRISQWQLRTMLVTLIVHSQKLTKPVYVCKCSSWAQLKSSGQLCGGANVCECSVFVSCMAIGIISAEHSVIVPQETTAN